jgi:lipopolysaccharide export system permease protein
MFGASTLQRYIAWRFVVMISGAFLVCATLIFMIDVIELLRQSRKQVNLPLYRLAAIGFLRLPSYTELILPFNVLVGSIGALMSLSRKSELAVMRAGGMSAWQFIRPGVSVAAVIGLLAVCVYNPLAARAKAESERQMAEVFGRDVSLMTSDGGGAGAWLRQDGEGGPSVMTAKAVSNQGLALTDVVVFRYDRAGQFIERVDADRAELRVGYWALSRGFTAQPGRDSERFETYRLATALDKERVQDALGSVESVSIWDLPGVIEMSERAQLPAARFRVQYQLLMSRPMLLIAMVLLAATVSLRSFRQGGIQTMVVTGMVGGIGFFLLTEVSRQIGLSGLVSAAVAVWMPVLVACMGAVTVLLHQEDG